MPYLLELEFIEKLLLAFLIGALMGLEREHSKHQEVVGLRTFALIALLGCLLGILSTKEFVGSSYLPVAGFLAVGALSVALYVGNLYKFKEIGMTTIIALLLSYVLGVLFSLGREYYIEATFIAIFVMVVLFTKQRLHHIVQNISHREMLDLLEFLMIVGLIYPFIPPEPIDLFFIKIDLISLWLLIVLISIMNLVGFIGARFLSTRKNMEFIGLLGGLISQKVSCAALGDAYNKMHNTDLVAGSLLMVDAALGIRNLVLLGLLIPSAIVKLLLPTMVAFGMLAFFGYRMIKKSQKTILKIGSPFNVNNAVQISLKLFVLIVLIGILNKYSPEFFYATIFVGGLLSGAATVASLAIYATSAPGIMDPNTIIIGFGVVYVSEIVFGAIPVLWFKKSMPVVRRTFLYTLLAGAVFSALLAAMLTYF